MLVVLVHSSFQLYDCILCIIMCTFMPCMSKHATTPISNVRHDYFCFRYCPSCKKHRQAIKKLDFWRLPETLVVHLKRFSYSRFIKNKLETFIDFPISDFYLSDYVSFKDNHSPSYKLYAIINHYGGTGSGHYTAFVDVSGAMFHFFHGFWSFLRHLKDNR